MKDLVLLIDSNIFLDVFLNRIPFRENSAKILEYCMKNKFKNYVAAHTIPNLYYIMRKSLPEDKRRETLKEIFNIFEVAAIDKSKILSALQRDNFKDFEDCLQDECALEANADYIITRNVSDFTQSTVKAILPEEFIQIAEL